jgi:hypothetical protein
MHFHGNGLHLALNGAPISPAEFQRLLRRKVTGIPPSDRRIVQTLNDGTTVAVTLYGNGTLKDHTNGQETTIDPNTGAVNLIYEGTDGSTRIIANVYNANGTKSNRILPLTGIRDANTPFGSQTGTGADPVWAIVMPNFNLVRGSYVNLMGGIITVQLDQVEGNTVMYLKEGVAPVANVQTVSTITSGGASVGGVTNVTATTATVTGPTVPPGVDLDVKHVVAGPLGTPPLGNPTLFTVDTTTGQLIRLSVDTVTGKGTMATVDSTFAPVALTIPAGVKPSVGLGQNGTEEVVLVGLGDTVYAFDAETGAAVGHFSVPQLASVDGIGSSALGTLFTQTGGNGLSVKVQASLASGAAVGTVIFPQREFVFNGGVTGVAGVDALYADGAAHFDPAQPNLFQFGTGLYSLLGIEVSRKAIPGFFSPFINAGPNGLNPSPFAGTGSLDTRLARLVPPAPMKTNDTIQLVDPSTEVTVGTVAVQTSDTLSGLSESYHPELAGTSGNAAQTGAAIVNINGNARRLVSKDVRGLIFNVSASINLVQVTGAAVDSAFIGYPLEHLDIPNRHNIQVLSNQRGFNGRVTRNGVSVFPQRPPTGPLSLPLVPPGT